MKKLKWLVIYLLMISTALASNLTDPVLSIAGTSTSQQTVSVTVTDGAGPIYYTTDGTNPTTSSNVVTSGSTLLIALNAMLIVQAISSSTTTSDVVTAQYGLAGQISAGTNHTLFLKNDGTVWASGDNSAGELGTGSVTASSQPIQVLINPSIPLTGIVAVAAGTLQSFAVDNLGNVWAWGLNTNGQLGTAGTANVVNPVKLSGLSGAVSVASSQGHTLALLGNGSVFAWGANSNGQVGIGTTSAWVTQPTQVLAPSNQPGPDIQNIVAIAAGANHSLALENTGKMYAWGSNAYGQLGNGDTNLATQTKPIYVTVSGVPFTSVVGIAADTTNSFALQGNGSAWSWGDNTIGELGKGLINPATPVTPANLSPAQVTGLTTMLGVSNQSALASNGAVWTWGDDSNGRLGVGVNTGYATLPLDVSLTNGALPTLTVTSGNGQTVVDGILSTAFTVTASYFGTLLPSTWINFSVPSTEGSLVLNSDGTQLSPIIGMFTNSQGAATVYLDGATNASGPLQIVATSGGSQTNLSAVEQVSEVGNTGPVGYFQFNEGSGTTTADASGYGNNGNLINSPTWVTGEFSNALSFNGTSTYVNLNNTTSTGPLKPALPVTISAWIKFTSTTGYQGIFTSDNFNSVYAGYTLQTSGGVLMCQYGSAAGSGSSYRRTKTGTTVMTAGQWYHVAAVIQGPTSMNLYVNGVDDGGTYSGSGGTMGYTTSPSKIGTDTGTNYFNGVIDDVRTYNRVLSTTEIGLLVNGPVSNWRFDEVTGTSALDSGTAGITGTLVNNPPRVTGWLGNALDLNGINGYVNLNNSSATGPLKPTLPITISAWINLAVANQTAVIFNSDEWDVNKYAGCAFQLSGGVLTCAYGSATGGNNSAYRRSKTGTTVLAASQWYHVAAVIQGPTTMDLYVNGVDDGGTYSGSGGTMGYTTTSSKIGTTGGSSGFLNGIIDDVRFYSRALSATEVQTLDSASNGQIAPE